MDAVFRQALSRFTASLTAAEESQFRFTSLADVRQVAEEIQRDQAARRDMMNLTRIEAFLEGMNQCGRVMEVFLNASPIVAFVWTASTWTESFNILLDAYEQIGENIPQFEQYLALFNHNSDMRKVLGLVYADILEFHRRALKFFKRRTWQQLFLSAWKDFKSRFQSILYDLQRHKNLIESQASILEFQESQAARLQWLREFQESQAARAQAADHFSRMREDQMKRHRTAVTTWLSPAKSHLDQRTAVYERSACPETGRWLLGNQKMKTWLDKDSSSTPLLWLNGIPGAGKTILCSVVIEELQTLPAVKLGYFYCKQWDTGKNSLLSIIRELLAQMLQQDPDLLPYLYEKSVSSGEVMLEDPDLAKELIGTTFSSVDKAYIIIDGVDECEKGERKEILSFFTSMIRITDNKYPGTLRGLFVSQDEGDIRKSLSEASIIWLGVQDNQKDIESYATHWSSRIQQKFGPGLSTEIVEKVSDKAKGMFLFAKLVLTNLYNQTSRAQLSIELQVNKFPCGLEQAYERIVERIYHNPILPEREAAKRLLGWIVCAKRPMKWHEIQGAVSIDLEQQTVDYDNRCLRVDAKDICGSLVEIHDGITVDLVHLTARYYLVERKHVNALDEEFNLASLCLQYLTLECFDSNLSKERIHDFLSKGYYLFLDYAFIHWAGHIESCTHGDQLSRADIGELVELVRKFIRRHPTVAMAPPAASAANSKKFRLLRGYDIFDTLIQWTSSLQGTKLIGSTEIGEPDVPGLVALQRTRSVFEDFASSLPVNDPARLRLELLYGPNWFKCPRWGCDYFHEGFQDSQLRDKHERKHQRPYYCSYLSCHVAELGCQSRKDLNKHMADFHPTDTADWKFPARERNEEKFFLAARKGRLAVVRRFVEEGFDCGKASAGRWGMPAIYYATKYGHEAVVHLLLEQNVGINLKDRIGWTPLLFAAEKGQKPIIKLLLERGAEPNTETEDGRTPLSLASRNGNEAVVQLLLENGADIKAKDNDGQTALYWAASNGHEAVAKLLLENGADIQAKNNDGQTALYWAASNGHEAMAKLLLEKGAGVEAKDNRGWTALYLAASNGHEAVAKLLLENGADVEAEDKIGWTALYWAASKGHEAMAKLLLENGADVEAKSNDGQTALYWAALKGDEAMAKLLLDNGADIEVKDNDGQTALHWASSNGHEAVAKLLLENRADVEAKDNLGCTALYWAASEAVAKLLLDNGADIEAKNNDEQTALHWAASKGHEAVATLLLKKGADVEAKDNDGQTVLYWAALNRHEAMAKLLIEKGADVEAKGNRGWTALYWVASNGHDAMAKLLIEEGADVEAKDNLGCTALYWAASNGYEAVAKLLLENGADVEAKGNYGWTALYWAAANRHEAVAKLLLENGADIEAKDNDGQTALHWAASNGHEAVAKLLLENGADIEAKDSGGHTALYWAVSKGHKAVAKLLRDGS